MTNAARAAVHAWWRRCAAIAGIVILTGCAMTPQDIARWTEQDGDAAASRIEPELYSKDPAMRQAATQALLKMPNSPTAYVSLAKATLSPDAEVRGDVGRMLVLNDNADLDFYAITLIGDRDPTVRRKIAEGLAAAGRAGPLLKAQRAGIYLWGMTQDDDASVRATAAEGLGTLGLNDPVDFALVELRTDPDPRVRAAAARGLGVLARAYLAGKTGPAWRDEQADQFILQVSGSPAPTVAQARGEEIVAALCQTVREDDGHYIEAVSAPGETGSHGLEETRWVAREALAALEVPGLSPRVDVASAQMAMEKRLPAPAAPVMARPVRVSQFAVMKR